MTPIAAYLDDPMVLEHLKSLLTHDNSRKSEDKISRNFLQVEYDTGPGLSLPCIKKPSFPSQFFFGVLPYDPRKTGKFDMETNKL